MATIKLQNVVSDTPFPSYVPYIRSQVINFSVEGLKPNTKLYPFFDGIDVSSYCNPSNPITDATGSASGTFTIPAGMFTTGTKIFTLANANSYASALTTDCIATGSFTASATSTFTTGNSTSTVPHTVTFAQSQSPQEIVLSRQTTVNPNSTSFKDPIAQTFFVSGNPNGIFATKLDIYFKTRPTNGNTPITLQIREVINGYPSDTILPYSTVTLYPKDVNPSTDATAPTVFVFPSPVYLQNNKEYCFVLIPAGNSTDYSVWIAEMGGTILGTNSIIDKQPNAGQLILSANGVDWAVQANQDIKFSLYRADFSTTGTLILQNKNIDFMIVSSGTVNVGDTVIGTNYYGNVLYSNQGVIQVNISSGTFSGTTVYVKGSVQTGTITTLTSSTAVTGVGTTFTGLVPGNVLLIDSSVVGTVSTVTDDTHLTLTANATVNATASTFYISSSTLSVSLDTKDTTGISPIMSILDYSNTNAVWDYKSYSPNGLTMYDYTTFPLNPFSTPQQIGVQSYSNKTTGSFFIEGTLTASSDGNVSPVVDISRTAIAITNNRVNTTYTDTNSNIINVYPGSITGTIDTSGTAVVGDNGNTKFLVETPIGSVLRDNTSNIIGVVQSVQDNTHLTLTQSATTATNSKTFLATYVDAEAGDNGFAKSRYMTKAVTLAQGQDAEDFRVYLDASIPGGTDIIAYAKLISSTDSSTFDSRPWVLLTKSVNSQSLGFGTYLYTIPKNGNDESTSVGGLNTNGIYQYTVGSTVYTTFITFAIKLILVSSNPSIIPTVTSMRAIALQA